MAMPCCARSSSFLLAHVCSFGHACSFFGWQWFSESGKLVQRLFEHIMELADDEDSLVCVLVDEVRYGTARYGNSNGDGNYSNSDDGIGNRNGNCKGNRNGSCNVNGKGNGNRNGNGYALGLSNGLGYGTVPYDDPVVMSFFACVWWACGK